MLVHPFRISIDAIICFVICVAPLSQQFVKHVRNFTTRALTPSFTSCSDNADTQGSPCWVKISARLDNGNSSRRVTITTCFVPECMHSSKFSSPLTPEKKCFTPKKSEIEITRAMFFAYMYLRREVLALLKTWGKIRPNIHSQLRKLFFLHRLLPFCLSRCRVSCLPHCG